MSEVRNAKKDATRVGLMTLYNILVGVKPIPLSLLCLNFADSFISHYCTHFYFSYLWNNKSFREIVCSSRLFSWSLLSSLRHMVPHGGGSEQKQEVKPIFINLQLANYCIWQTPNILSLKHVVQISLCSVKWMIIKNLYLLYVTYKYFDSFRSNYKKQAHSDQQFAKEMRLYSWTTLNYWLDDD